MRLLSSGASLEKQTKQEWRCAEAPLTQHAATLSIEEQLDAALETGDAITIETPIVFHCNLVSASVYNRATPLPPAP